MGLNGYIGATCPGLNLAVLAFVGLFSNRKVGTTLLVVAIIVALAEFFWYMLIEFAVGMSATPQRGPTFIEQGTGILNLIVAGVVFFILLGQFAKLFPLPKGLTITMVTLFYIAGAGVGIVCWIPIVSHGVLLVAVGLLVALCYAASAPFAIAITALLFLALAALWGVEFVKWRSGSADSKREARIESAFLQAVANNQQEQIAELWNSVDSFCQEKALSEALAAKNVELTAFLIKQGVRTADVITEAIYHNDIDSIKMLVEAGAPIESGYVKSAARRNFLPAVQLFVEKGADINQGDPRPLSAAYGEGHKKIIEYLLKTGKNSQETLNEALVELCSSYEYRHNETERKNLAKLLLAQGAQVNNHAGYLGATPLHEASTLGSFELVKLFVEKGADVNAMNEQKDTPLRRAVEGDHIEIVKFLLQHGANKTINQEHDDPNDPYNGETALFKVRSPEIAELLLANGAKTSYTNNLGETVLLKAVYHRNPTLVKMFLDRDVDVNARNKKGETALLEAVQDSEYSSNQIETVKLLLEKGADVNLADNKGNTPLLVADKLEVLQLLLDHGAQVNVKNKNEETPLIKIAQGYDEDGAKVKLLLDRGADVNTRDQEGKTALYYASSHSKRAWYSEKQIEILKQYGAKK